MTQHYENKDLGLSFDYNDGWQIRENWGPYEVGVQAMKDSENDYAEHILFDIFETSGESLMELAGKYINSFYHNPEYSAVQVNNDDDAMLGGLKARKLNVSLKDSKWGQMMRETYVTAAGNTGINVIYSAQVPNFTAYHNGLETVLSSIRFSV